MKRLLLSSLLGGLLATNTGCGLLQAVFCYRPCAARGGCAACLSDDCDGNCGPVRTRPIRGPVVRHARAYNECDPCGDVAGRPCRRVGCQSCGSSDPCADPCGEGSYGRCWHRGPLSCVFALFTNGCWFGGCSGCGERYWGDFYSDPPDCWDPCDGYGNYSGGGSVSPAGGGGCRSCGHRANADVFDDDIQGSVGNSAENGREQIISQSDREVIPTPKPAGQPHKAIKQ